jgi:DNA-binding GntR family transcriptional regulator
MTHRQRAYEYIRDKITSGAIPTGERVSASAIALELGVSHIPVREAISQLQSEGLIVHRAHQGAVVRGANRDELVDLIELRTLLEANAAAQAARQASPQQMAELETRWREILDAAEALRAASGDEIQSALRRVQLSDLEFHMTILRAAGNRRVLQIIQESRVMTYMFGYRTNDPLVWSDPSEFAERTIRVHGEVYQAIRRRDAKAAKKSMAAHMRQAGAFLLSRFDRQARGDIQHDSLPPAETPAGTSG